MVEQAGTAQPELEPEPAILGHYEVGLVQTRQAFQHEFFVTNAAAKPLQISAVYPLCDCIQVVSWPKTIAAGGQDKIVVLAQPQRAGPFETAVQIDIIGDAKPRLFTLAAWADDGAI